MATASSAELRSRTCKPCEGGVEPLSAEEAQRLLGELPGWELSSDGKQIRRRWQVKNFVQGLKFLNAIGEVAEKENHHPDLHLTGYKHVKVELSTHAIGGLSENDFILAAKIDPLAP